MMRMTRSPPELTTPTKGGLKRRSVAGCHKMKGRDEDRRDRKGAKDDEVDSELRFRLDRSFGWQNVGLFEDLEAWDAKRPFES